MRVQACPGKCVQSPVCMTILVVLQAAERADEQAFLGQPSSQLNQKQAEPDSAYLQEAPLWAAYRLCAARARAKNVARKEHSMALLKSPDGRKLLFGREARANIDSKVIDRIRCCVCLTALCFCTHVHGLLCCMIKAVTAQNVAAMGPVCPKCPVVSRPFECCCW